MREEECPKVSVSVYNTVHRSVILFYFIAYYTETMHFNLIFFFFFIIKVCYNMVCQCNLGILTADKNIPIIQRPIECKRLTKKCSEANI